MTRARARPIAAGWRAGVWVLAGCGVLASALAAQPAVGPEEPVVVESVVASIDDATNTADFTHVTITQGAARITADRAHAIDVSSKDSRWTFSGQVTIASPTRGLPSQILWADEATAVYRDGVLVQVVATGAPARFEQRRTVAGQVDREQGDRGDGDRGQADEITYDVPRETIRLSGHAQILQANGLELDAPLFVFQVREGRLQASSGDGTRTVHIVTRRTRSLVPQSRPR